jgi:hypothetical protein
MMLELRKSKAKNGIRVKTGLRTNIGRSHILYWGG